MTAKRPQERPEWDEILKILSDPATEPSPIRSEAISQAIKTAVSSAISKKQEQEKKELAKAHEREEWERFLGLYRHSCEGLLLRFRPLVDQFNESYQFGKIRIQQSQSFSEIPSAVYLLPTGAQISVKLYHPKQNGIPLRRQTIIGGGMIGLAQGRSANLVPTQESRDDLYGQWRICEVKLMAIADPRKIIGRFGITAETIEPFGFESENDFYDQIRYANGGMHVFTYSLKDDVTEYFSGLIADGCA